VTPKTPPRDWFFRGHGLGNDYLVLRACRLSFSLTPRAIRLLCDRHAGVGSDGILLHVPSKRADAGLRILNPDGSEAEKSGNGLRIFARYLWDASRVDDEPFVVETPGGAVRCQVRDSGRAVFVEMGRASFDSQTIPVAGPAREVVAEPLEAGGQRLVFTGVTVGNPHCVIHVDEVSPALAQRLGALIENHPLFPNRTNVQFVRVVDPHRIRIEIWERGAGYTLASGSSSCAAAAASVRLGLCAGDVRVEMPGGAIDIGVAEDFDLTMLGPVGKVASGELAGELLASGT
jgi:diaminopimelate epimerase